jgi:hypothetical protein
MVSIFASTFFAASSIPVIRILHRPTVARKFFFAGGKILGLVILDLVILDLVILDLVILGLAILGWTILEGSPSKV